MKNRQCIMVVDDEPEIRKLLECSLEPEGYKVLLVSGGKPALALMKKHEPDMVILDITMPGMNGFQFLKLMRQHSNVPVIMLTGNIEVTALRDALSLGADDYVRKPFQLKELLARIRAKLRRAGPEITNLKVRRSYD